MSAVDALHLETYAQTAVAVLLMYDFAVTSTDEIDHIWRGKFTGWKFLFFVNRYTSLAKAILIHLGLWHVAVVPCHKIHVIFIVCDVTSGFAVAAFNCLRVWAIWGRPNRWWPFFVVLPFALMPPCVTLYRSSLDKTIANVSGLPMPFGSCTTQLGLSSKLYLRLSEASRSCAIMADLLVLVFTWVKTYNAYRICREAGVTTSIGARILEDGTIYFASMLICNILQLAFNVTSFQQGIAVITLNLNNLLPSILTSRFLLDLHKPVQSPVTPSMVSQLYEGMKLRADTLGEGSGPSEYCNFQGTAESPAQSHSTLGCHRDRPDSQEASFSDLTEESQSTLGSPSPIDTKDAYFQNV